MRSLRSLIAIGLALGLFACSSEDDDPIDDEPDLTCQESVLSYDNFGDPFFRDWCTGCHNADLAEGMRQGSPTNVNFNTREGILLWRDRVQFRALEMTNMPPTAGPAEDERALLSEWLDCGAP